MLKRTQQKRKSEVWMRPQWGGIYAWYAPVELDLTPGLHAGKTKSGRSAGHRGSQMSDLWKYKKLVVLDQQAYARAFKWIFFLMASEWKWNNLVVALIEDGWMSGWQHRSTFDKRQRRLRGVDAGKILSIRFHLSATAIASADQHWEPESAWWIKGNMNKPPN